MKDWCIGIFTGLFPKILFQGLLYNPKWLLTQTNIYLLMSSLAKTKKGYWGELLSHGKSSPSVLCACPFILKPFRVETFIWRGKQPQTDMHAQNPSWLMMEAHSLCSFLLDTALSTWPNCEGNTIQCDASLSKMKS